MSAFSGCDMHVWCATLFRRLIARTVYSADLRSDDGLVRFESYLYHAVAHALVWTRPAPPMDIPPRGVGLAAERIVRLAQTEGDLYAYDLRLYNSPGLLHPDSYRGDIVMPVTVTHAAIYDQMEGRAVHGWVSEMEALFATCTPGRYVLLPVMPTEDLG